MLLLIKFIDAENVSRQTLVWLKCPEMLIILSLNQINAHIAGNKTQTQICIL